MIESTKKILEDLYALDPELRKHEATLIKIVENFISAKPDTKFDVAFAKNLKNKLMAGDFAQIEKPTFAFSMNKLFLTVGTVMAVLLIVVSVQKGPNGEKIDFSKKISQVAEKGFDVIKTNPVTNPTIKGDTSGVRRFASEAEFKKYLASVEGLGAPYGRGGGGVMNALGLGAAEKSLDSSTGLSAPSAAPSSDRYSSTNVQVVGIDEPDMVKNDGNNIFLSTQKFYPIYYMRPMVDSIRAPGYPYPNYTGDIKIINALPAKDLKVKGKIPAYGDLLLYKNILVSLSGNIVYGYDVTDKENPKEKWKIEIGERNSLVGARLYDGKLYVATQEWINSGRPCPYQPLTVKGAKLIVPCDQIYHPIKPVATDILYTVSSFNTESGENLNHVSFTGSSGSSVLYMSQNAMYLTYTDQGDMTKFAFNFLKESKDIVPADVLSKLEKLLSYDISDGSKQSELYQILSKWLGSLGQDEQMKVQNNLQNRMGDYYKTRVRELGSTSIVKTSLSDLKVQGVGEVPGTLLNQYSMDEYQGNLRVAVTIGQNWWYLGNLNANTKSVNDVYVLGSDMKKSGEVLNLGVDERIYSARFIGDRGYLVTFKQIDPFYVLDLSNPKSPSVAGELKIPGYSSYLEPIGDHLVLGVGMEDNKVKVSLFDVSNPKNPTEISKFTLNEYWSEANNNPHAFLRDDKHKIFFIPGGQGGYIFSYADNKLNLVKTVSDPGIVRAIYINDTLYTISPNKITAFDEKTWEKVSELTLTEPAPKPLPMPTDDIRY